VKDKRTEPLTSEELQEQEGERLPDREAMTLITPNPGEGFIQISPPLADDGS
jgi:hypothetical protein